MRIRSSIFYLRWVSLLFISLAVILTIFQIVQYSALRSNYPNGMVIAGVDVGNLDPQSAAQRILQVYSMPIVIQYDDAIIHLNPGLVGFELNLESMFAAADLYRVEASFWGGFWNYLWNRESISIEIPLVATISRDQLQTYLQNEIAARYDDLPTPPQLIPGSTEFQSGEPGTVLDIDRALLIIEDALQSSTNRNVTLSYQRSSPSRPTLQNLQLLLQSLIDKNDFAGLVVLYLMDLQTGEELHFGYRNGVNISVEPDVAFSADSTNKIPVMVSVFKKYSGQMDDQTASYTYDMISTSSNEASDAVLRIIGDYRGPLVVTNDMQALGLDNICLTAFFSFGSPALDNCITPANQRFDITTYPDPLNQTTASDIGALLTDIYQCAEMGGGALISTFPGQIDQTACQEMITLLKEDKIGVLIQAGVPEGTAVAHKHGWSTFLGQQQGASDAAIVYTPGGNYILTIFVHDENYNWNTVSLMFAELSQTIYNYFNLSP